MAESFLMKTVIFMAVTLVVAQAMLVEDPFRTVMGKVGVEPAFSTAVHTANQGQAVVTLYLENHSVLPHLQVLVNGNKVAAFDSRYVTVLVQNGDIIEVDGTFYKHNILVKVIDTIGDITNPVVEQQLNIENNVISVQVVKN